MMQLVCTPAPIEWEQSETANGNVVLTCHALKQAVYEKTFAEAYWTALEVFDLLFSSMEDDGELDKFLVDKGWHLQIAQLETKEDAPRFAPQHIFATKKKES